MPGNIQRPAIIYLPIIVFLSGELVLIPHPSRRTRHSQYLLLTLLFFKSSPEQVHHWLL